MIRFTITASDSLRPCFLRNCWMTGRSTSSIPRGNSWWAAPTGIPAIRAARIIVDTYGGMGRHGGGALSGKDPSKVDRSAAYHVPLGRQTHRSRPGWRTSVNCRWPTPSATPPPFPFRVDTFGTGKVEEKAIESALEGIFSFKPADMVDQLDLLRPIYRKTTHYGHFTNPELPWEQLDETRLASLKQLLH